MDALLKTKNYPTWLKSIITLKIILKLLMMPTLLVANLIAMSKFEIDYKNHPKWYLLVSFLGKCEANLSLTNR